MWSQCCVSLLGCPLEAMLASACPAINRTGQQGGMTSRGSTRAAAALLCLGALLGAARAQITVSETASGSVGVPGTYDPCLDPPSGVQRVRGAAAGLVGASSGWRQHRATSRGSLRCAGRQLPPRAVGRQAAAPPPPTAAAPCIPRCLLKLRPPLPAALQGDSFVFGLAFWPGSTVVDWCATACLRAAVLLSSAAAYLGCCVAGRLPRTR